MLILWTIKKYVIKDKEHVEKGNQKRGSHDFDFNITKKREKTQQNKKQRRHQVKNFDKCDVGQKLE